MVKRRTEYQNLAQPDNEVEVHEFHMDYFQTPIELAFNKNVPLIGERLFTIIKLFDKGEEGCFASNAYLASLLDVTTTTISTSISKLEKEGFIKIVQKYDITKNQKRVIRIDWTFKETYRGHLNKFKGGIKENLKHNSNRFNRRTEKEKTVSLKEETDGSKEMNRNGTSSTENKSPYKEMDYNLNKPYEKDILGNETVMSLFEHWCNSENLTKHKTTSKVGIRGLKALGKLLEFYNEYIIQKRISTYSSLMLNRNCPGHRVNLDEFLFGFSKNTRGRIEENKVKLPFDHKKESWFSYLSDDSYKEYFDPMPYDEDPKLTRYMKKIYTKKVLGGINGKYSQLDERKFILAGDKLREMYKPLMKDGRLPLIREGITEFADWLLDHLIDNWGSDLKIGHLKSDHTFNVSFPQWLDEQAAVSPL